jgi:hypothetical protein
MTTHGIGSIWLAEIGRRLRAGETSISLKDVVEATGARGGEGIEAEQLWANLWRYIEAEGLAKVLRYSAPGEDASVARVRLTEKGTSPAAWHD